MDLYFVAVVILFGLAIFDLVAGVANDAVNFINSAVGSRVASRSTILLVATVGILIGAFFSSGMMEIAKSGVFNPENLSFQDVMIIFLAVLITDVILLDAFNTFGLPTSTTVSLVFELLGAAVIVAIWKIVGSAGSLSELAGYINTAKALAIMAGILTSVWISFTVATVVQYFSRLLFSFQYEQRFKWIGSIWSGTSFSAMTYFLLIKGLKGASFVSEDMVKYVDEHSEMTFVWLFVGGTIVAQLLTMAGVNVLKLIVLYGTMALAMAFAGNDLVNFIGPSVAALDAYRLWCVSGVPADEFMMGSLKQAVQTNPTILLAAGVIMGATLWLSKKARTVTETSVSLSRQEGGIERFKPNAFARFVVITCRQISSAVIMLVPAKLLAAIDTNFQRPPVDANADRPAFDLIRASVNLTTASSLIAIGTALKLPLSTTYVTFLVAMGSSFADRAWGRESAVYRVSGVLNVIGGWFLTALVAFVISAFFATAIYFLGVVGVVLSLGLATYAIYRSFHLHAKREEGFTRADKFAQGMHVDMEATLQQSTDNAVELLKEIRHSYLTTINGFIEENSSSLRSVRSELKDLESSLEQRRVMLFQRVAHCEPAELAPNRRILKVFDLGHDILLSLRDLVKRCSNHVLNSHLPPNAEQAEVLRTLAGSMDLYLDNAAKFMEGTGGITAASFKAQKLALFQEVESLIEKHSQIVKNATGTMRNSESIARILMEAKDLVAISARMLKHFDKRIRNASQAPFTEAEVSEEDL